MKTSRDLLNAIQDTLTRLRDGTIDVNEAHAETRLYDTASRVMAVQLEHARLTSRLEVGSSVLPDFDIGDPDDAPKLPAAKNVKKLVPPRTGEGM